MGVTATRTGREKNVQSCCLFLCVINLQVQGRYQSRATLKHCHNLDTWLVLSQSDVRTTSCFILLSCANEKKCAVANVEFVIDELFCLEKLSDESVSSINNNHIID